MGSWGWSHLFSAAARTESCIGGDPCMQRGRQHCACDRAHATAYARGVIAVGSDYQWHWRVHVGLWAAFSASKLDGDFVECGVNRGFLSSAIMEDLDWDRLGKTFYLLDTFAGVDEEMISTSPHSEDEIQRNRRNLETGFYVRGVEGVFELLTMAQRANYSGTHSRHPFDSGDGAHQLPSSRYELRTPGSSCLRVFLGKIGSGSDGIARRLRIYRLRMTKGSNGCSRRGTETAHPFSPDRPRTTSQAVLRI